MSIPFSWILCSQLVPVSVRRFIPRQVKEFRRWSQDWTSIENTLRKEEKYLSVTDHVSAVVISLSRDKERSSNTLESLRQQNIDFEVFEGVDGLLDFGDDVLMRYASSKRVRYLRKFSQLSSFDAFQLYKDRDRSSNSALKKSMHESLRFGCFLSHIFLWQKVQEGKLPFMVILEDDVVVEQNFLFRLHVILRALPKSWDLLYLNGCFKKFGPWFTPEVRYARGGLCTFGYVISSAAAQKLLSSTTSKTDRPIDHVLDNEVMSGRLFAFHVDPPLVRSVALESTMAY